MDVINVSMSLRSSQLTFKGSITEKPIGLEFGRYECSVGREGLMKDSYKLHHQISFLELHPYRKPKVGISWPLTRIQGSLLPSAFE